MLTVNLNELFTLGEKMIQLRNDVSFKENQQAVRFAVAPVLKSMRSLAPVGKVKYNSIKKGPIYSRGGSTKRDLRIKNVASKNGNEANIIVGVSKARMAVGWRTHFLIHGTKRMAKNSFMEKATAENLAVIPVRYERKMRKIIDKRLKK
jgi:HK97 gp10 family phage protein